MTTTNLKHYRDQVNTSWEKNRWWIDGQTVQVEKIKNFCVENRYGELISVRQYQAKKSNEKVLFYIHGGGWVGRNIDTYDNFCRRVCHETGMTVYSIGYRLAPETKFPGALHDCIDVIQHLISEHSLPINQLNLCGDSAGGNMAIGITYVLQKDIFFQKLLLFYPPVSACFEQPSMVKYGKGHIIEKEKITWMLDQYLPSKKHYTNPLASPIHHHNFNFLPDTLVTIGKKDPLYDQVIEFTKKAKSSGGFIQTHEYMNLPHGFYLLYNLSEVVKEAYKDVYRFLAN